MPQIPENLPDENTDPWYFPFVNAWNALRNQLNLNSSTIEEGRLSEAGLDEFIAEQIATPGTATATQLSATFVQRREPLDRLAAFLAKSTTNPVAIVFAGGSTPAGAGVSRWFDAWPAILTGGIQREYASGNVTTAQISSAAVFTVHTIAGVHGYSVAEGNTQADTYLPDARAAAVAALSPAVVFHMVGSNDFAVQKDPATYAAQLSSRIAYLDGLLAAPVVHVLVHAHHRRAFTPSTYSWAEYGAAMAGVAAAQPLSRVFIDASVAFASVGIPAADPLGLIVADNVHLSVQGHALMASVVGRAIGTSVAVAPKSRPEPSPMSNREWSDGFTADGGWNASYVSDLLLGGSPKTLNGGGSTVFSASGGTLTVTTEGTATPRGFMMPEALDCQVSFDLKTIVASGNWWIGLYSDFAGSFDYVAVRIGTTDRVFLTMRVGGESSTPYSGLSPEGAGKRFAIRKYRGRLSLLIDGVTVFSMPVPAGMAPLVGVGMHASATSGGHIDNIALDILS